MAAWLAIDWDQDQFHILAVQSSRRGVQVTGAATWPHPEPFTPSTAERVGKALREFLKAQKITPAPVIVGLGRDRLILKELRFPAIAPHEEAALVRFQTAKELTESPENYVIDYAYLAPEKSGGDRHVMAAAARRDMLLMFQNLCLAAGLKLHAITPRLFGAAPALVHSDAPDPNPLTPDRRNAVLVFGQRWAGLCFFRGERLIQAQALANGPLLVNEVKRNLAVFNAQHAIEVEATGPDCLFVFGDDESIIQALQAGVNMPIVQLDPLENSPELPARMKNPAAFAGALGLALLWSQASRPPINLAAPKKHFAPTSVSKQRGIFYGVAAAVVLFLIFGAMYYVIADRNAKIRALVAQKTEIEKSLKGIAQERAELEAYKEWEQTNILWLDEIYDLTARYPFEKGFRVNQFAATTAAKKKDAKDSFVGRVSLTGFTPSGTDYVKHLHASMMPDPHIRGAIDRIKLAGTGSEYQMKIDVIKQGPEKFTTQFVAPKPPAPIIVIKKVAPKDEPMKEVPEKDAPKKDDTEPEGEKG